MSEKEVETKAVPEIKVASLWAKGLPFNETVPRAFGDLISWMMAKGLPMPQGSPMCLAIYYDDPRTVAPQEVRFKVAMLVPKETKPISEGEVAVEELPAREVAYMTVLGPYENLEKVYARLGAWVYQKGYRFADAPREVYVRWGKDVPQKDWVTEIQFPVEH